MLSALPSLFCRLVSLRSAVAVGRIDVEEMELVPLLLTIVQESDSEQVQVHALNSLAYVVEDNEDVFPVAQLIVSTLDPLVVGPTSPLKSA